MKKYIIIIILIIILIYLYIGTNQKLKLSEYSIYSDKVKDDIKIAHLSDLHSYKFKDNQKELVDKIKKANVDLIFITGDFSDERFSFENCEMLLKQVVNIAPIYYVSGNHEHYDDRYNELLEILKKYKVNRLNDEKREINFKSTKISISGLEDPYFYGNYIAGQSDIERIKNIAIDLKSDRLNLLLSHRPELANYYDKYGFDVTFSGHAHGGKFRFPPLIKGIFAPGQWLLPKYTKGVYNLQNNNKLIVSVGLEIGWIPRIYNNPELVIVNLKRQ